MAYLRPGGAALTDRGLQMAGLRAGSRILDVGCGEGDTVAYLNKERGMAAEGIDMNLQRIAAAKELHPGADVKFADGEFLDSYMSFTFDGILMESSLSQINIPEEALHEAWCVMKKGGKLVISDLYEKDPDPQQVRAVRIEALRQGKMPHQEGDCEDRGLKFVDFRFAGAFYRQPLLRQLEEIGFQLIAWEDRTEDLEEYLKAAEAEGKDRTEALQALSRELDPQAGGCRRKIGYFLLAAAKPL